MKKILTLLGTITLIGTSTTSLVACNTPQYTEEKLAELKEENKISISGNTLEWMAPQERPFNKIDSKWYFVIWRGDKGHDWRIVKFRFKNSQVTNIDGYGKNILQYSIKQKYNSGLLLAEERNHGNVLNKRWEDDNKQEYFKSVYRWDDEGEPKTLIIDPKTGEINKEVKKDK